MTTRVASKPLIEVIETQEKVPVVGGAATAVNLDSAATTPCCRSAWEAVAEVMPWYGSVHRGAGYPSTVSTELLDRARASVLAFAGGTPDDDVAVYTHNATASMNLLARRLAQQHGGTLCTITSAFEHSSNYLPWRRSGSVRQCEADPLGSWNLDHLEELLRTTPTQVVAVTAASNVTGRVLDVDSIARIAHRWGAVVAVDASQYVAHRELPRREAGGEALWDYVVFSGHKMYAPFGIGVVVGSRATFSAGWPDRPGGGTVRLIDGDGILWEDLPEREEGGTPNYPGVVALAAACADLRAIGFEAIRQHEEALIAHAMRAFDALVGVELHRPADAEPSDWLAVFPFAVHGFHHAHVAAYLGLERGIAVRSGHLCQYELARVLARVEQAERDRVRRAAEAGDLREVYGVVRASMGPSSTLAEIDALSTALRDLVDQGPRATYEQAKDGRYHVVDWSPPLPATISLRP